MTKERFPDVSFDLDFETVPQEIMEWAKENIGENDKDIKIYEFREMIYGKIISSITSPFCLFCFKYTLHFTDSSDFKYLKWFNNASVSFH